MIVDNLHFVIPMVLMLLLLVAYHNRLSDYRSEVEKVKTLEFGLLKDLEVERITLDKVRNSLSLTNRRNEGLQKTVAELKARIKGLELANLELQQECSDTVDRREKWYHLLKEILAQWPKNWRWVAQDIYGGCKFHRNKPKYSVTDQGFISKDSKPVETNNAVKLPTQILDRYEAEELLASLIFLKGE